jgi:hypothetical protein
MRSEKVDAEEVASTKSEKWLAAILIVFVSMGAIWVYSRVDNTVNAAISVPRASMALERARRASDHAWTRESKAQVAVENARQKLLFVREAYRTALEARVAHVTPSSTGSDNVTSKGDCSSRSSIAALKRCYQRANAKFFENRTALSRASVAATRADTALDRLEGPFTKRVDQAEHERTLLAVGLRVLLALSFLGGGYWLLASLRRRSSRYMTLSYSIIVSGVLLCLVTAGDYENQYVDLGDLMPLALSLVGCAVTVAAFFFLQRYLARRVPLRRVRKGECPFCGYPLRAGVHCEGCGRQVIGQCSNCGEERRVGTNRCASCGGV